MRVFEKLGKLNTDETLEIAINKAIALNTDIVVATSSGDTAFKAIEKANKLNYHGKIIAVTLAYGTKVPGENPLSEENRHQLTSLGVQVVTAAHVLSGAERGISKTYHTISPIEIMADTLRMISRGIKVCVEIGVMALDVGAISYQKPVVCIGGSGGGADSACVMTPEYAANILKTKIHEILCMPY